MKIQNSLIAIILILSTIFPISTLASTLEESYILVHDNKEQLTNYLQSESIEVEDYYSLLPIIQAKLTDIELEKAKKRFPAMTAQKNVTYKISTDSVLPSLKPVNSEPKTTSPYTGKGVSVAVLDTGIDTEHRDLNVKGGYCAKYIECSSNIPFDDNNGHGTHVAGVIAGAANGTGIVGIAPSVDLYGIKVLNDMGVGTTTSIVNGIEWAIKNNIDILNLSITTSKDDPAMKAAIQTAYDKGMIIVGSAGNKGGEQPNTVTYPAKYPTVIAVGAVNADLTKLHESSIGEEVELSAPGGLVLSTYPVEWDFNDDNTDGYTVMSGTSMAAPHVTGVAALYKERFPKMSNIEIRALLTKNAKDIGVAGKDHSFGYGLVQYVQNISGTASTTFAEETGKGILGFANNSTVTNLISDGRTINQNSMGQWELYGVAGNIELYVTTNTSGIQVTEKQYVKLAKPIFSDVKNSQWFSEHIGFLSNQKQITGWTDQTFRPYNEITRGEVAALIGRALGYSEEGMETDFKDVPKDYFASGFIQKAVNDKIINGFGDGTFRPAQKVTRAEMAILISKAFEGQNSQKAVIFKDISPSMASYQAIQELVTSGITKGYDDSTFRPYEVMNRSQFAVFVARAQNSLLN